MIISVETPKTCDACPCADQERDFCRAAKHYGIWCYNEYYFGHRPFWCPIKEEGNGTRKEQNGGISANG